MVYEPSILGLWFVDQAFDLFEVDHEGLGPSKMRQIFKILFIKQNHCVQSTTFIHRFPRW
jgi:hypothetical protein